MLNLTHATSSMLTDENQNDEKLPKSKTKIMDMIIQDPSTCLKVFKCSMIGGAAAAGCNAACFLMKNEIPHVENLVMTWMIGSTIGAHVGFHNAKFIEKMNQIAKKKKLAPIAPLGEKSS